MRQVLFGLTALVLVGGVYSYLGFAGKPLDPMLTAKADVKNLEKAAVRYCARQGEYPVSLDTLVQTGDIPADVLRDPWKHEYQYDPAGRKNKGERPDIWTVTPGREVIGNWAKDRR
ncbi:MAG TPA: type II secretion system protein GspG [Gemmataceae bacterium]|jgi:hypothetical protein